VVERVQEFARTREERPRPAAELRQKRCGWHHQVPFGDEGVRECRRFERPNLELAKERTRRETLADGSGICRCPQESPQAVDSGELNEYATKVEKEYRCAIRLCDRAPRLGRSIHPRQS
jgi:hypothetical protein